MSHPERLQPPDPVRDEREAVLVGQVRAAEARLAQHMNGPAAQFYAELVAAACALLVLHYKARGARSCDALLKASRQ
jgi:hypothetical protein